MATIARTILKQLEALGAEITIAGHYLAVKPSGALTPQMREMLRRHKADILDLLRHEAFVNDACATFESSVVADEDAFVRWRDAARTRFPTLDVPDRIYQGTRCLLDVGERLHAAGNHAGLARLRYAMRRLEELAEAWRSRGGAA